MTSSAADSTTVRDLVTANRILVRRGVLDAFGHVSARSAPGADSFLLSRNLAPGSVTQADVLLHDLDGETGDPRAPYLERFVHAEIYRRRPDVMAVVHSHSPAVVPFGLTDVPLRAVIHMAGFIPVGGTRVYEISAHAGDTSNLLITSSELGAALAETLGDEDVVLMRGHGSVITGSSVAEAVYRAVYAEVNASVQAQALALGRVRYLSEGEADAASKTSRGQIPRAWNVWSEEVRASIEDV